MSVAAVRAVLPVVLLTVVFAIVIGVVFYVKGQLTPAGLTWPSAFDTALNTLTSFGTLVVIVALAALVIFVLISALGGSGIAGRFVNPYNGIERHYPNSLPTLYRRRTGLCPNPMAGLRLCTFPGLHGWGLLRLRRSTRTPKQGF